jgi:hypothetical protein
MANRLTKAEIKTDSVRETRRERRSNTCDVDCDMSDYDGALLGKSPSEFVGFLL